MLLKYVTCKFDCAENYLTGGMPRVVEEIYVLTAPLICVKIP
jgi:hypothetical protein